MKNRKDNLEENNSRTRRFFNVADKKEHVDMEAEPEETRKVSMFVYNALNNTEDSDAEEISKPSERKSRKSNSADSVKVVARRMFNEEEDVQARKTRKVDFRKLIVIAVVCVFVLTGAIVGGLALFGGSNDGNESIEAGANLSEALSGEGVKVLINIDNTLHEFKTEASTVSELLDENNIEIKERKITNYELTDSIEENMEIVISSPIEVTLVQEGISTSVTMYGGTVLDVFEELGILYEEQDIVLPDVETTLEANMEIVYNDVEIKEITVVEEIPYETEEGETNTVNAGLYAISQEGANGVAEVTYAIKYVDGVEESREEISRVVAQEATNKIMLWGTAIASNNNDDDSGSSDGGSSDSGDYDDVTVSNPGEQATNPSVPASPSSYLETMSGHVTAYTHTGSTTATGTWPRSTRTLDNPGSCAVVPATIPYGSLIYVTGYGYCIAEDTGGFRHDADRWNQIDLFMNTKSECMTWGRRDDVKVYILRRGY